MSKPQKEMSAQQIAEILLKIQVENSASLKELKSDTKPTPKNKKTLDNLANSIVKNFSNIANESAFWGLIKDYYIFLGSLRQETLPKKIEAGVKIDKSIIDRTEALVKAIKSLKYKDKKPVEINPAIEKKQEAAKESARALLQVLYRVSLVYLAKNNEITLLTP